jgi:hypothetical protein
MQEDKLKLFRAVTLGRKTITVARVLLLASTLSEAKREEISRWLVSSEKDLAALEQEMESGVAEAGEGQAFVREAAGAGGGSFKAVNPLLSPADKAACGRYPQRSYAMALEDLDERVTRGAVVELVCRLFDGLSLVRQMRPPQAVLRVPHAKLVVVQEGSAGISFALAECETVVRYEGAGPELSFEKGASILVVRVNPNGWWLGLLGAEAVAGLFPATAVRVTTIYSPQMTNFSKKLARALTDEQEPHPNSKFKLAMAAAIHNRGSEEVSAYQMQIFNERRWPDAPAVLISSSVLEFSLTGNSRSASQCVVFKCPDMGGTTEEMTVQLLPPRLGPNLLDRLNFHFDPPSFQLAENEEEEIEVTASASNALALDANVSVVIPVVFSSKGGGKRRMHYFLLCDITTPTLRQQSRLSVLIVKDRDSVSSSELWGETMTSGELAAAGMSDLLSDLLEMPESKRPVPPARAARPAKPPPALPVSAVPGKVSPRGRAESMNRASDSSVVKQVQRLSQVRTRTASAGNQEEATSGSESGTPLNGSSGSTGALHSSAGTAGNSPRSMLANVRARLTRNRSQSTGDEEAASPQIATKAANRKSPRSPRMEEGAVSSLSPVLRKAKSKGDVAPPEPKAVTSAAASPPPVRSSDKKPLERRNNDTPVVRRRETEVERKPGWVASIDRRNSPSGMSSPLVESSFGAVTANNEGQVAPPPVSPKSGPPRKALPPPPMSEEMEGSGDDTPIMVEFDSLELAN